MPLTRAGCAVLAWIRHLASALSTVVSASSGLNSGVMGGERKPVPADSSASAGTIRTISTGRWCMTWMMRPESGSPFSLWEASSLATWALRSGRDGGTSGVGSGCIESMVAGRSKRRVQRGYIAWILGQRRSGSANEHESASEYAAQGQGPARRWRKRGWGEEEGRKQGERRQGRLVNRLTSD